MFVNPQGPSSSPIEVTLKLSFPFDRHKMRRLCVELEKLAQLERELEHRVPRKGSFGFLTGTLQPSMQ